MIESGWDPAPRSKAGYQSSSPGSFTKPRNPKPATSGSIGSHPVSGPLQPDQPQVPCQFRYFKMPAAVSGSRLAVRASRETVLSCCKQACSCRFEAMETGKTGAVPPASSTAPVCPVGRSPRARVAANCSHPSVAVLHKPATPGHPPRAAWQAGFPRCRRRSD
jgi:hypothetical protein